MKIFKWSVETIVCKDDYSLESFSFEIEIIGDSKQEAFQIAKYRTQKLLEQKKQKFRRINICWLELKKSYHVSKYQRFIRLYESKRPRNAIMNILQLPFWKLREYEEYYNGNTKPLTQKVYLRLKEFLTNEQIRRRYKIPECEFRQFLKGIKSCATSN
ncbi:hypothetical protein [Enterococcus termitis]|uniref:Uncharacterized protein n=1 Tax=Enterococcus termitis TaxID=332950 RepID=A0A1E5GJS5_9ENTE|nr:hypothetical protein [Enterococcus termitis]OEG12942.1 hypothetical protein BCR25_05485 [Enterococcus termitis]OJG99215.1 hypothetical protein RV18_GL002369 [Enterococcus termitis]